MRIVVIGHTGFLGSQIVKKLNGVPGVEVMGLSTKDLDLNDINSQYRLKEALSDTCTVIMCAGVKKQLGDNLETFERNLLIVENFCRGVAISPPEKIIYLSSASVYGEDIAYKGRITESTSPQLRTYYGIAKYSAECLLRMACETAEVRLITLRLPLIYGIGDVTKGYGPTGFSYRALAGEEIILWGDGSECREFIFIEDIGEIVSEFIGSEFQGTVNVVSGTSYTFLDVISYLEVLTSTEVKVTSNPRTKPKVDHRYSNELIKVLIDDFRFTNLKDGLGKLVESINIS